VTHRHPLEHVDIGIDEAQRRSITDALAHLLADTYTLYLKTHNYHWNVTGARFRDLHLMFEEQYNELALAVDNVAERIRTLGAKAPGSYASFARLSVVKDAADDEAHQPGAEEMLRQLAEDNATVVRTARAALDIAAGANDESSASLISDRMVTHEKAAWMLRSMRTNQE
jgi:starvation-inducible DNA-binding protein